MLETLSERLSSRAGRTSRRRTSARAPASHDRGGGASRHRVHHRHPLRHRRDAGERVDTLLAIRELHERHGHVQEVIVQNFRASPASRWRAHPSPTLDDLRRTLAVARLLLGPDMNVQAPPNLSPGAYRGCWSPGSNDCGGISPLTPDHINPEAPWPHLDALAAATAAAGFACGSAWPIYPEFIASSRLVPVRLRDRVLALVDPAGLVPTDGARDIDGRGRRAIGDDTAMMDAFLARYSTSLDPRVRAALDRALDGGEVTVDEGGAGSGDRARPAARSRSSPTSCGARQAATWSPTSSTGTSTSRTSASSTARFCAFCRDHREEEGYFLPLEEVVRRGTGGAGPRRHRGVHAGRAGAEARRPLLHRSLPAINAALPDLHIHAFSPEEVLYGVSGPECRSPSISAELRDAGLGSLPGTSAEILDDELRDVIAPGRITTASGSRSSPRPTARHPDDLDDDVRARRDAGALGPAHGAPARRPEGHGRLHGVRAAVAHPPGSADVPPSPGPGRPGRGNGRRGRAQCTRSRG